MNTHELAANLRRHARKIPSPAGDTPSVMVMAADRLESTTCELAAMKAPPAPGDVRAALAGYAEWTGNPPVLTDAVELIDQQAQRIAALETKCDTLKRLHDAAADERDALRAKLAAIEAQDPVAQVVDCPDDSHSLGISVTASTLERLGVGSKLYARHATAQAVPDGQKLVPVEPTTKMIEAGRDVKRRRLLAAAMALREGRDPDPMTQAMAVEEEWSAMIAEAPEYKA